MKITFEKSTLEAMEKAFGKKDLSKLHKEVITDKNGKRKTVWKKNGEKDEKKQPKGEEKPEEKTKKTDSDNGEHSYAHTKGDHVCFMQNGQRLTGEIVDTGKDGVTIKGTGKAKGQVFKVLHEDVKQVTKMINPNDAIRDLMDKENIKPDWRGTDGYQPESCDTIEGLLATIGAAREEFNGITDGIKSEFEALNPIVMKRATLKSVDRIKEKLREDQKDNDKKGKPEVVYEKDTDTYHCRTIRDCDGHTICLNSIADVANVLKHLDKQPYAARIKNNFAKPSPVGYSNINANIKLSNGAIVELQVNTTANMIAKERYGHALYEVYRSVESNPKYAKLAELMGNAQKDLYGLSNKYSREGNFPTGDIPKDSNGNSNIFDGQYKHEPFAAAIRDKVSKALPLYQQAKAEGALNEATIKHFEHLIDYLK